MTYKHTHGCVAGYEIDVGTGHPASRLPCWRPTRRELAVITGWLLAACGAENSGEEREQWQQHHFSGDSGTETASFRLGPVSVVNWSVDATGEAMYAGISLHDESGRMVQRLVNQSRPGTGETRVRGAGMRYLKVDALNCSWAVTIRPE